MIKKFNEMNQYTKKMWYTHCVMSQIFFDQDGNFIKTIHENDANYRNEYMKKLFNHFGIEVEWFEFPTELTGDTYDIYDILDELKDWAKNNLQK